MKIICNSIRMSWNYVELRRKHTRRIQDGQNSYDCVHSCVYVHSFLTLLWVSSIYISRILKNNNFNLAWWKNIKNRVPSALCIIHELSQNPVTTRSCRWKKIKGCAPICCLVLPHIDSISIHDSKTLQDWLFSWNKSITIKAILTIEFLLLSTLKMLL